MGALLAAFLQPGLSFAASSPCDVLRQIGHPAAKDTGGWMRYVSAFFPGTEPPPRGTFPLYFTRDSDFAIQPSCYSNGSSTRGKGLYYPVGLVVRVLGDATIGYKPFKLVETEHGIRTFIPERHLERLDSAKAYFFADSHDLPPLGCAREDCNPVARAAAGQVLHPQNQFAATAVANLTGALSDDGIPACQRVPVSVYRGSDPGKSVSAARLDLCLTTADGRRGSDSRIKVVTDAYYQRLFRVDISGALIRAGNNILDVILPGTREAKNCGQTTIDRMTGSVGGEAGAQFSIYFLKLGTSGKVLREWQTITEQKDTLFLHYGSYTARFFGRNVGTVPMQSYFACDDNKLDPEKPIKFSILHPEQDIESISFKVGDATRAFKAIDAETFLPTLNTRHVSFKKGRLWMIKDHIRFFQMRDSIASLIRESKFDEQLQLIMGEHDRPMARRKLVDFLTYLILMATTEFG